MKEFRDKLPDCLVERILDRLGFTSIPAPDFTGMQFLYRNWCHKVPFDNLLKRIFFAGNSAIFFPGNDEKLFFENWLEFGVGGTCWAVSSALCTLLATLGFDARRRRGTMLIGRARTPDHGSVTVSLDNRLYLLDASMLHNEPLELSAAAVHTIDHPAWGLSSHPDEGDWLINWRPLHLPGGCLCRIESTNVSKKEWLERNNKTRLVSPFNKSLYARINAGEQVIGIEHGGYTIFHPDGTVERRKMSWHQILKILEKRMGYNAAFLEGLPEDALP